MAWWSLISMWRASYAPQSHALTVKGVTSKLEDLRLHCRPVHEWLPDHRKMMGTHCVLSHFRQRQGSDHPPHTTADRFELSSWARQWAVFYLHHHSLSSHQIGSIIRENWSLEKLSNCLGVIKLVNAKVRTQILLCTWAPASDCQGTNPSAC